jgi:hypothetical protein
MRRAQRRQRDIMEGTVNFTRMDQGTYEEYQFLESKFKVCYDELPDNMLGALKKLQGDKLGYHIDRCDLAAAVLKPYVSEANHWLVRHHPVFQGYYYYHHIGRDRFAFEKFRGHPHFERTHMFCDRWDQMSFDPNYDTMPMAAFEPMVRRLFTKKPFVYGD